MKNLSIVKKTLVLLITLAACTSSRAQDGNLTFPEASQKAIVQQRIGLTDITITYHSPLVKGRKIWGELVPYNEVWRAGANENTVIAFSNEVMVEGKPLAAGTYGLHMIPTEADWTIIFSKNSTSWGSFFYDKNEDALRINVKTAPAEFQEWLSYQFTEPAANSTVIALRWDKLKVPFKADINVPETVYRNMKDELRGVQGFTWQGPMQAARYCANNNIHPDEAMKWIDQSIQTLENFNNLRVKSKLIAMKGQAAEADALMKKAMTIADEAQLNTYGYELLGQKKNKEAIDIFRTNVKRYPDSWNVYDSLGEGFEADGNTKESLANYKTALSKAPDAQKKRIEGIIKKLESKKAG